MLDPFTALGVVSNIIAAVDFASKVVKGSVDVYKSADGTNVTNRDLGVVAQDLALLINRVRTGGAVLSGPIYQQHALLYGEGARPTLTHDQASLQTLVDSCQVLFNELLRTLETVKG